jgi:beta-lactamase class C
MLEKRIFHPLRMRDASADPSVFTKRNPNLALPHVRTKEGYQALSENIGYYNIAPAAGVNVSINDMSIWLLALLGNKPDIIDTAVLRKIATPVVVSPLKWRYTRHWGKVDSKYYSLGWRIYQYKGRKIVYHGGYVKGYRTEIAFCPEEKLGMAFLQNSPNGVASLSVPTFFTLYFDHIDNISDDEKPKAFKGFWLLNDTFTPIERTLQDTSNYLF